MRQKLDENKLEEIKEYMDSVDKISFDRNGQVISVEIMDYDIEETNGGKNLIYEYQLV